MRRSRIQWAFLAVVLAVSILAATLLSTLYLLSAATETFAARAALTNASAEDTSVTMRVAPNGSLDDILAGTDAAASELFGDVPYARSVTTQGELLAIPRGDRQVALGYLGSADELDDLVSVRTGEAPEPSNGGPVQILVPAPLLYDLKVAVGDVITLSPYSSRDTTVDFEIVGTYAIKDPDSSAWAFDRFSGQGFTTQAIIPFSRGAVTDGYGPLYTAQADVETFALDLVIASYTPDFSGTSLAEVREILARSADLERIATRNIGDAGNTVTVATTVGVTLGGVAGSLAVTRSSVLVTGLLLLVLAVAALSQTARLMAERRYAEQHLMIARGSSGRQLFRLGLLEAVAMGIITTLVAAPLARLSYLTLAQTPTMSTAGMNVDPGIPPLTWVVAGVVGLILIAVLVAPLAKRQGSFVDAEQARSRPGRRAAFQRSGLDIAVLALAALAYWQLKNYQSPVLASGGVATVDPLLAAGPALALLAGALVAVRLIPPASKVLEALAARGRRAVLPLAAWEVGRRSARAVSAILLLTLAVSIGTFAVTFLTSWQKSQADQAQYQHPPDAIVTGVDAPWLAQRQLVSGDGLPDSESPVVSRNVKFGPTPEGFLSRTEFNGAPVTLVATDTTGLKTYGVGRLNEIGGSRVAETLGGDIPAETNAIEIPGKPQQLSMDVVASTSQDIGDVQLILRAVIRNDAGDYQTVQLGQIPLDDGEHHLVGSIATTSDLNNYSTPMYLVGLQATWISLNGQDSGVVVDGTQPLALTVSIDDVEAQVPVAAVPAPGVPAIVESTPLDIPADLNWTETNDGVGIDTVEPDGDQIHMRVITSGSAVLQAPVGLVLTAAEKSWPLRLVASASAIKNSQIEVEEGGTVQIGSALIPAFIAERVPALAGDTLGAPAIAANIARLQVANVQAGGNVLDPAQWWIDIDDSELDAYEQTLPAGSSMTSQSGLTEELTNDPLRIAIQAALWLVTGAAVVLAALGFAVHAIVTVRAREIELAQMRAIGVQRGQLLRIVASENALLSFLGLVFGVGLGIALSYLVAPLVSVGADGRPPLPPVVVTIPWNAVGLLVIEVALVLLVSVIIVAAMLRRIKPAEMLRLGDER